MRCMFGLSSKSDEWSNTYNFYFHQNGNRKKETRKRETNGQPSEDYYQSWTRCSYFLLDDIAVVGYDDDDADDNMFAIKD